ncbi:MAG: hypothetical protein AAB573_03965 [Patescibacteria group bacterium]
MTETPTPTEQWVEKLTTWLGSIPSLLAHTVVFIIAFSIAALGYAAWDIVLLVVTTVVSLEAIYLALFIQMTVNRQTRELHAVSVDVEDIQEDIEEISEDVEGIQEDVEEISEDVEGIQEDVEEMSETEDWDLETGKVMSPDTPVSVEHLTEDVKRILINLERLKHK